MYGLEEVAKPAEGKHEVNENDVLATRRLASTIATCPKLVSIIHETGSYIIVSALWRNGSKKY